MVKRISFYLWVLFLLLNFPFSNLRATQQNLTTKTIYQIAWSPSGDKIASVDYTNVITIWDTKTQSNLLAINGISNNLSAIRWSPDGLRLAANSYDAKKTFIWDATTGKLLQSITEDTGSLGLAWIADGNQILTGTDGIDDTAEVRRWDIQTGKLVERYTVGGAGIFNSPDGSVLAIAPSYWLELHDAITLDRIAKLYIDNDYEQGYQVSSVVWSSDGNLVAAGYLNGKVRIWDIKTSKIANEYQANDVVFENRGIPQSAVIALAFTMKNTLVSSVSRDGSIRQWDVNTGKLMIEQQLTTSVTAANWSADGKQLAFGDSDGTLTIWEQD